MRILSGVCVVQVKGAVTTRREGVDSWRLSLSHKRKGCADVGLDAASRVSEKARV